MRGEEVADRRRVGQRLCHDRISGSVAARRFLRKIIMVGKSCNCFTIEATYACGLLMEGGGEVGLEGGGREKGEEHENGELSGGSLWCCFCVSVMTFFFNY